jgi:hypothetical protein
MDTLRTPAALATLVATNLVPLAGIVFLGWSPTPILIIYLVDTLLGLGAVVLLVMAHVTGNDHGRRFSGWKDWLKALGGLVVLGAIFGLPLALPIVMVVGDDAGLPALLADPAFAGAIVAQAAMSALAVVRQHRELERRSDDDRVLAGRLFFLVARWIVMFLAVVTGAISFLGPAIGGALLVALYAAASVYFELFPERAQRFVRGKSAKAIAFDGDLDAQAHARRHAAGRDRPSQEVKS